MQELVQSADTTIWTELIEGVVGPVVINCDKDTQRWSDLCAHLSTWGVRPTRFSAFTSTRKFVPFNMPAYAAFLAASWSAVLRQFHTTSDDALLVLEDDCRFLEDPRVVVLEALTACVSWSVISLGSWKQKRPRFARPKTEFAKPQTNMYGSHSVLVRRDHALRLAEVLDAPTQSDLVLNLEYRAGRGYLRRPSATYQHEYPSHHSNAVTPTIRYADLPDELKLRLPSAQRTAPRAR